MPYTREGLSESKGRKGRKQEDNDGYPPENEGDTFSTLPKSKGRKISPVAPASSYCEGCGRNTTWLVREGYEECYKCHTHRRPTAQG